MKITELERVVGDFMLAGSSSSLAILRQQFAAATVVKRDVTDAGFFTEFHVPAIERSLDGDASVRIGDVNGRHPELVRGLGFLMFIDNGKISALEGYTYNETMPSDLSELSLEYISDGRRELPACLLE